MLRGHRLARRALSTSSDSSDPLKTRNGPYLLNMCSLDAFGLKFAEVCIGDEHCGRIPQNML